MNKARGAALIMMVILMTMAMIGYLVQRGHGYRGLIEERQSQRALNEAHDALLGWAIRQSRFGEFPCPDLDDNGVAQSTCPATHNTVVGRLPWKSLNMPANRDGGDNRLWYALSEDFSNNSSITLDQSHNGQLDLDGATVLAVVIAPGRPLNGQTSRPSNQAGDYTEDDNADNDNRFVSSANGAFNDKVRAITVAELFSGSFAGSGMGSGM